MIRILLATSCLISLSACGGIEVPFFQSLKPADVCGAVPDDCQPTSSLRWTSVDNLDYRSPEAILGRTYRRSIFETSSCGLTVGAEDYLFAGQSSVSGTLTKDGKSDFGIKASGSLNDSLREALGSLPDDVEAQAKAELRNAVTTASESGVSLKYFRVDLTNTFLDQNLSECLSQMSSGDKFVTGASVIETSGEWSRSRVTDFVAAFEASAAYQSLDAGTKAEWQSKKDLALSGTFQPVRSIFAVAYRTK